MNEESYPALYRTADQASLNAQQSFLRCIKGYAALSITGAALGLYGIESTISALLSAIILAAALGLPALMAIKQYENIWYRTRAVAESVKTLTWRFMMRAEPFNHEPESEIDQRAFAVRLRDILANHQELGHELAGTLVDGEQITEAMRKTRLLSLDERLAFYRDHRVDEQRTWYSSKSKTNKIQGECWFWVFVGLQSVAVVLVLLRIGYPQKIWPTEVFIVAGASVLGWLQVKRYRELASAYALTAQEIGIARTQLSNIKAEQDASVFVGDTENAFSREHTQWVARRDNPV